MRKKLFVVGMSMGVLGLGLTLGVPYFYYRSNTVSSDLLKQADKQFAAQTTATPVHNTAHIIPTNVLSDTLLGEINIPKLSLKAPILEGVADKEINVAVGHLPTSVLPGENGTSILAAHNATWFRHIDELKPGDGFDVTTSYGTYTFTVTGAQVVHVGAPVKNSDGPSIVLEACYPLDALYLTQYRYLVFGNLSKSASHVAAHLTLEPRTYSARIPTGLPSTYTQLADNTLPLGRLTYVGTPSASFVQSNAPLEASNAMVTLYLAWQHATAGADGDYLGKLMTVRNGNNIFLGFPVDMYRYESLFNITLDVQGNKLLGATATDIVTIHHTFKIVVRADTKSNQLVLRSVDIIPYT